jgi:hypothetical protein
MLRSVLMLVIDRNASTPPVSRMVTALTARCSTGKARCIDSAAADLPNVESMAAFNWFCAFAARATNVDAVSQIPIQR